jgi:hypothetical protein
MKRLATKGIYFGMEFPVYHSATVLLASIYHSATVLVASVSSAA